MTDLATLGLRVESQEVATADTHLDNLASSANRAETSVDKLAAAARRADGATGTMNVAVRQQQQVLNASRNAMGLTAAEGLNLSRQFADIGVTAAMGMNPLMIAIQQGPQLLDIFQMAAIRTGTTVRAAMLATGAAVWTALAPLIPIIAGIAIVAGTTAVAFGLATRSMSQDIGDVAKEMNLTEEQMKRLKDQGVSTTITMGDYFRGLGTTIKEVFVETFGNQLSWVGRQWKAFLDGATRASFLTVQAIGTGFLGTFYAVRDTWKLLPATLGDAAHTAAAAAVDAINWLIRKSVEGINNLRSQYNALPAWMRGGQAAPLLTAPQISGPGNPYAGGMRAAAGAVGGAYSQAWGEVGSGMRAFQDRLQGNVQDSAEARIRKAAGDGPEADAAKKAREQSETGLRLPDYDFDTLRINLVKLEEPLKTIADEFRLINGLAQETAQGLASAFGETGRALGDLLTTMTSYQSRMAEINLAEKEYQITAAQAERERAYAQVKNYGDMIGAARGFFEEGSDGYKTLQAAEQVYRAYQLAMSIQAMVMGGQETAFTVGQNLIRSASHGVVAVARALASLPFPLNLAAGAATAAALAAIGVKLFGGGSKSGGGVAESVATSQGYGVQNDRVRSTAAEAVAGQVNVVVTADRQGLNAYVRDTASTVAAPMAGAAYQGAVSTSREAIPAEQTAKANMTLRAGRR